MSDNNRLITDQELLVSNMLEIQALIRILIAKGITTETEIFNEIVKLKDEMDQKLKDSQKMN